MRFDYELYSLDQLPSLNQVQIGDRVGLSNSCIPTGITGVFESFNEREVILFDFNREVHKLPVNKLKYLFFVNDVEKTILAGDVAYSCLSRRCSFSGGIFLEEVLANPLDF